MRILLVNYRYFISGGPEKYMFNIKKMLEDNGHEVIPFSIHSNKNVETEYSKYFVEPIGSRDATYFEECTMKKPPSKNLRKPCRSNTRKKRTGTNSYLSITRIAEKGSSLACF